MKRKLLIMLFTLLAAVAVRANDGVFYASGGTLVPLQETRITLRKELLRFYVVDHGYARVEVDFEFYNPSNSRMLTVGFVTPPSDGDFDEAIKGHPFITDFTVNINGRDVPFKMQRLASTTFKKGNANLTGRDWVYYFQAVFRKGSNKVRHTYRFRGGASVEMQRDFNYQITTGKRWANRRIDDFELQIHPDNGIFMIVSSFSNDRTKADWEIVGDGVIEEKDRHRFGEEGPKVRLFHLNNGFIRLKATNFRPDNDLFFGEFNWPAGWWNIWCDREAECFDKDSLERISRYLHLKPWDGVIDEEFGQLSAKEVRYLRNYFFALRGLEFRDPELKRFYEQFVWYKPVIGLKATDIVLSRSEDAYLKQIAAAEAKRKN